VNVPRVLDLVEEGINLSDKPPYQIVTSRNDFLRLDASVPSLGSYDFDTGRIKRTLFGFPLIFDTSVPDGEIHLRYSNGTAKVVNIREEAKP
jgi:hypothetical protein